jgi:hypothetical protein
MIILDTDHFSILCDPRHSRRGDLLSHMNAASGDEFATTIVTVLEQPQSRRAALSD